MFNLYFKEYEFGFNNRGKDVYQVFLKIFKDESLVILPNINK